MNIEDQLLMEKALASLEHQTSIMRVMQARILALTATNTELTEALNAVTAELESLTKAHQMDAHGLDEEDTPKLAALLSEPTVFDSQKYPRYMIDDTDEAWIRIQDLLDRDETENFFEFFAVAAFAKRADALEWLENHQEMLDYDPSFA